MAYGYAIELFFDKAANEKIRRIWTEIALVAGVPNNMAEKSDSRPHIALSVFGNASLEPLLSGLKNLAELQPAFDIRLDSLGMFEKAGALWFGPTSNRQLLDFHQKCYKNIHGLVENWEDYYLPERLVFHCTLNIRLSRDELLKAANAGMNIPLPILAKVESIGLMKLPECKLIQTYPLAGSKENS